MGLHLIAKVTFFSHLAGLNMQSLSHSRVRLQWRQQGHYIYCTELFVIKIRSSVLNLFRLSAFATLSFNRAISSFNRAIASSTCATSSFNRTLSSFNRSLLIKDSCSMISIKLGGGLVCGAILWCSLKIEDRSVLGRGLSCNNKEHKISTKQRSHRLTHSLDNSMVTSRLSVKSRRNEITVVCVGKKNIMCQWAAPCVAQDVPRRAKTSVLIQTLISALSACCAVLVSCEGLRSVMPELQTVLQMCLACPVIRVSFLIVST